MTSERDELLTLANLWCEGQVSQEQLSRLQFLLRNNGELRELFLSFVRLHGQLAWDAGMLAGTSIERHTEMDPVCRPAESQTILALPENHGWHAGRFLSRQTAWLMAASLLAVVSVVAWMQPPRNEPIASGQNPVIPSSDNVTSGNDSDDLQEPLPPIPLNGLAASDNNTSSALPPEPSQENASQPVPASDAEIVATINQMVRQSWDENGVAPAIAANDSEWVRRTYLTLTGRIPTLQEATGFLQSGSVRKRQSLLEELVSDQRTSEHLAVIWTNLLIGRSNPRGVDEEALFAFLEAQFSENKPWMDTVGELIAAEGRSDQNGATNFLLAHLNDQATPATAVTARLFLGRQVHCTQCHDHPFARDRGQDEFWSLNAFFKQAVREVIESSEKGGAPVWTLNDRRNVGMTFYENRKGEQQAVLPEFAGQTIPVSAKSRRAELVRLLAADSEHQVARAMVNRMWAMFFGYGFTNPIDDIGPHSPASHPELFDFLTRAFVESDYDLQKLMYWIAMSEPFALSSAQDLAAAANDNPESGGAPLFSRTYARSMEPEQVYDSLRIAIRSMSGIAVESSVGTQHRREWVSQFVEAYGTDENDEQLLFDQNISQALLLMNGQDLQDAIPRAAEEVIQSVQSGSATTGDTLERVALATLNRKPTEKEEKVFRNRIHSLARSLPAQDAVRTATEDMLWAYLNSSEFVSLH